MNSTFLKSHSGHSGGRDYANYELFYLSYDLLKAVMRLLGYNIFVSSLASIKHGAGHY